MKSKREIEKKLWPLLSSAADVSSQDRHSEYVKFQRDFQKKLGEQLKHNPITVEDLVLRVDVTAEDLKRLLFTDLPPRKKS
jgi:hypothetical protein